jgi:hypothetical protein
MRRAFIIIGSLSSIVIVLSIVQICVSNAFSTDGITLGNLQQKIGDIQRENMILKEKIYTMSAYTAISAHASAEGFVDDKSTLVVGGVQPLAIRQ